MTDSNSLARLRTALPQAGLGLLLSLSVACAPQGSAVAGGQTQPAKGAVTVEDDVLGTAIFAGGCFWCVESAFDKVEGVSEALSGYTDGRVENPTYKAVSAGRTGHTEAVLVRFDPTKVTYEQLVDVFWRQIDPTDLEGQFADRGSQYRPAIYVLDDDQRRQALSSRAALQVSGRFEGEILVPVLSAQPFYRAEEYHQDYWKKNKEHYERYHWGSGRGPFLKKSWARPVEWRAGAFDKPGTAELEARLTKLQFKVTQHEGTERPFSNEYWDNKEPGIYVDIVSGEPLFSSTDKFRSGTGWPSFVRPLEPEHVVEKVDRSLGSVRTEIRSLHGDSHLGHVFPDGPKPTGLRYCLNSAALRFVPKDRLADEGYARYLKLF